MNPIEALVTRSKRELTFQQVRHVNKCLLRASCINNKLCPEVLFRIDSKNLKLYPDYVCACDTCHSLAF